MAEEQQQQQQQQQQQSGKCTYTSTAQHVATHRAWVYVFSRPSGNETRGKGICQSVLRIYLSSNGKGGQDGTGGPPGNPRVVERSMPQQLPRGPLPGTSPVAIYCLFYVFYSYFCNSKHFNQLL